MTVVAHSLMVFLPYVVVFYSFEVNRGREMDPVNAVRDALDMGAAVACLLIAGEVWYLVG